MNKRISFIIVAASFALSGVAAAASVSPAESQFLEKAYQGGSAEVTMGRLAEQKGSSASVRSFGALMVHDHSQNLEMLEQVASREGVSLSKGMPADASAEMEKLKGLSGTAFDREYINYEVMDHKKDIADYKKAVAMSSGSVKSYAEQTLPVIEHHESVATADSAKLS